MRYLWELTRREIEAFADRSDAKWVGKRIDWFVYCSMDLFESELSVVVSREKTNDDELRDSCWPIFKWILRIDVSNETVFIDCSMIWFAYGQKKKMIYDKNT